MEYSCYEGNAKHRFLNSFFGNRGEISYLWHCSNHQWKQPQVKIKKAVSGVAIYDTESILSQAPWISMTFVFCDFQVPPVSRILCPEKCETSKCYTSPRTYGLFIPSDLIAESLKSPLAPPCWSWSRFLWQLLDSENMERHLRFGDRNAFTISRQRCMYSGTYTCSCLPPLPPQTLLSGEEK